MTELTGPRSIVLTVTASANPSYEVVATIRINGGVEDKHGQTIIRQGAQSTVDRLRDELSLLAVHLGIPFVYKGQDDDQTGGPGRSGPG